MLGNYGQLTPYNPQGKVYELCTATGLIYQVTDGSFPTMGMNGWYHGEVPPPPRSSVLPYWGDMLCINGKAKRILLAGHNVGGTSAYQWSPAGELYPRSLAVLQWLDSLGIPPNYWIEMLGQADVDQATPNCATTARNFADLMQWKWGALRSAGLSCPIVMGQGAHWTGFSNVQTERYALVKQGQLMSATGFAGTALGPDDDEWPDAGYRVDGVHPADGMRYWQMQRWLPAFPVF